jgi:hypothetical protein
MKPEELRARLRGGIAFLLCLPEILFSGFQQCSIVTLRSKLATNIKFAGTGRQDPFVDFANKVWEVDEIFHDS